MAKPTKENSPAQDNVAPAQDNVAPAQDNVAPAQDNVAPAQDNVAPAQDNVARAGRSASVKAPKSYRCTVKCYWHEVLWYPGNICTDENPPKDYFVKV